MSQLSFYGVQIDAPDGRALLQIDQLTLGGGLYALTGANGVGKSTFLKTIMNLHPLTKGTIKLDACDSRRDRHAYFSKIIYQPQNFVAYPELTAAEFLIYFLRLRGAGRAEARKRSHQWLELVGLSHAAHRRTATFSQGMLQRLGLAYALQSDSAVLVLDEPFAGVDTDARAALTKLLADRAKTGIVLTCTHHIDEIVAFGALQLEIADQRISCSPGERVAWA
jgi:ABC-2 type transport system ATP-binding protein